MQQNTIENGQRAMQQAVEFPLEQTVAFQKNAASMLMNGLEIGNWAQRQGIELTNDALDSYLQTVENTVRNTERAAETGVQATREGLDTWQRSQQQSTGGQRERQPIAVQQPPQQVTQPTQQPQEMQPQQPQQFQQQPQQPPQIQQPPQGIQQPQQVPQQPPRQPPQGIQDMRTTERTNSEQSASGSQLTEQEPQAAELTQDTT